MIGKDLSNPIPPWAEHGNEHAVVPYDVADGMDSPDPDPGEEYQHTNTQLFNILDEVNRFKDAREMEPPFNAPRPGQAPTMDGFVADYISFFTREVGRQPTYEEYRQIMTGYTPEQVPVLSAIARGFGVFDHWFSEVPSQTLTNRSFWTAGSSSGLVVNRPMGHFMRHNNVETLVQPSGPTGSELEGVRPRAGPDLFHGFDPHAPRLEASFRHTFRALFRVRETMSPRACSPVSR